MAKHIHHSASTDIAQCHRYGHILKKAFTPGERLCTRCGKKVYCPVCTARIPRGATLAYCLQHDPQEAADVERSVQP